MFQHPLRVVHCFGILVKPEILLNLTELQKFAKRELVHLGADADKTILLTDLHSCVFDNAYCVNRLGNRAAMIGAPEMTKINRNKWCATTNVISAPTIMANTTISA